MERARWTPFHLPILPEFKKAGSNNQRNFPGKCSPNLPTCLQLGNFAEKNFEGRFGISSREGYKTPGTGSYETRVAYFKRLEDVARHLGMDVTAVYTEMPDVEGLLEVLQEEITHRMHFIIAQQ